MSASEPFLPAFRSQIARRLGLWFEEHRHDFLTGILDERIALHGGDAATYCQRLSGLGEQAEWQALANLLTVNETYFMRGEDHFRALVENVVPDRLRAGSPLRPLRFLSAGCASGEEAYSLAISLQENSALLAGRPVEIIGVDINRNVLGKAREARYSAWSLRETSPAIRGKYFHNSHGVFVLDRKIAAQASFQERNLAEPNDDLWVPGSFDAIFCRNMLMYFLPETAAAIVARIQRALVPGGYLFLGHAESLRGLSHGFHLRRHGDAFYYQRRDGDERTGLETVSTKWLDQPLPAAAVTSVETEPVTSITWMDEIGRASARIAALAAMTARPGPPAAVPVAARKEPSLGRVLDLHRQERFTDALAHLEEMSADEEPEADVQVLQAMLLVNCGRLAEAEARCRPLLGRDDLDPGAHYVFALCREHAGDYAAAEEHAAAAVHLDPSFAMPRFHLGLISKRLRRTAPALAHFESALALLAKEEATRLLLFGGGFSRESLMQACRGEIQRLKESA